MDNKTLATLNASAAVSGASRTPPGSSRPGDRVRVALPVADGAAFFGVEFDLYAMHRACSQWHSALSTRREGMEWREGRLDPALAFCKIAMTEPQAWAGAVDCRPRGFIILIHEQAGLVFAKESFGGGLFCSTPCYALGRLRRVWRDHPKDEELTGSSIETALNSPLFPRPGAFHRALPSV